MTTTPPDADPRPTHHHYSAEQIEMFLTSPGRKWDLVGRDIVMQLRRERDAARAALDAANVVHASRNDIEQKRHQMQANGTLSDTGIETFDILLNYPNVIWATDDPPAVGNEPPATDEAAYFGFSRESEGE